MVSSSVAMLYQAISGIKGPKNIISGLSGIDGILNAQQNLMSSVVAAAAQMDLTFIGPTLAPPPLPISLLLKNNSLDGVGALPIISIPENQPIINIPEEAISLKRKIMSVN